ncbi:MAG TPA: flippase [Coleofasciculaceae cyanobacterium]|jgi:O-antigen/teichoic acid export membrane protein
MPKVIDKLSPGLRKIIRNIGWLSGEKVLGMILNLSIGIYVIRYLGSEDFGKLSYCLSLVDMFGAIAKLGLDGIVVRELVQDEESTSEILGTAFILKLFSSLVTLALIAWAVTALKGDAQTYWITIVIAWGLMFNSTEVIDFWFQSKVLARSIVIIRSTKLVLSSAAKLLFILLRLPLSAFVWLILADAVMMAAGTIWIYLKQHQSVFVWQFNFTRAIALLKDSFPLILSGVMVVIYMKIDQIMLGNLANNQAVGNYAAAVRFSEVWYFFPVVICSSVFPAIIRARGKSQKEYYDKLQQLYDLMAWMSLLIAVAMTFLSGFLVDALLGKGYAEAGNILALHIWAGPFVFLGVARSKWLIVENFTRFNFATTILGAITNVWLNFVLIPIYGGVGAAIATVIAYAVSSHVACFIYPKMFNCGWMLTKALFVPLRIRQNFSYLNNVKKILS